MSLIASQNWDGVSPPAIPGGWNVLGVIVTTAAGVAPISSPNMIATTAASVATITYATKDGNNGNVIVNGTGLIAAGINNSEFSVFARSSASTTNYTSSTFYEFAFSPLNGWFAINKWLSGTLTNISKTLFFATPSANAWYRIIGTLNGSTIQAQVIRVSDSFSLNMSTGAFQSSPSTVTIIDTSITGQGYSGWSGDTGVGPVYGDDWSLSTAADTPNLNQYIPSARVIHEAEKEPGRSISSIGKAIPPTAQFAKSRSFISFAEPAPQHQGSVLICGSRTTAQRIGARPLAAFTQVEPPRPYPGSAIAAHGGVVPPIGQQRAVSRWTAKAEPPPSPPGSTLGIANRRVETPLTRKPFPPTSVREEHTPDMGAVIFHVNPHHDRRFRRTWVARGEDAPKFGGSVFWAAVGGPAHVNRYVLPKYIAQAEAPNLGKGSVIFDTAPLLGIPQVSNVHLAIIAQAEAPRPFPGSAFADVSPLVSIARVHAKKTFAYRGEDPPVQQGSSFWRRPPLATPLLSSRVIIVQGESPKPEPGSFTTGAQRPVTFNVSTYPVTARSEMPPSPAGSVYVDVGQPIAFPRFSAPPETFIAWAEPPRPEMGRIMASVPPQKGLPPLIVYIDPRLGTMIVDDTAFNQVDPRRGSLGPEYPYT